MPHRSVLARSAGAAFAALFALVAPPAGADDDLRLGDAVVPAFQRVFLDLDPARADYSGRVHVDLVVREATKTLRFHASEMELGRLALRRAADGVEVPVERREIAGERVELVAAEPLAPGAYTLDVDFANDFGTKAVGLYRTDFGGDAYAFTQFEAIDAREAFPCWDEPGFKQPWQLVLTVPAGLVAATNAPLAATARHGDRETLTFAATEPLPAYLVAIAVGPFDVVEIPGASVPARILAPRGMGGAAGTAAKVTPPLLAELERYFGRPYPFAKLDLVAVPEFWPGAMENAGLVTFADRILLLDPARATPGQVSRLAEVDAHELAHMWFGDLVTTAWWDDLWLNESFADWLATKVVERVYPEHGVALADLHEVQEILARDGRPTSPAIRRPIVHAEESLQAVGLAYDKGRAVLDMVEGWLGEEAFRRGVVRYIGRHAGGNAVGADFWRALAEASDEAEVATVLAGFLDQPGYPLIEVEPIGDQAGAFRRLAIRQRRFVAAGSEAPDQRWTLPLVFRWGRGDETGTATLLLEGDEATLDLGREVDWVLPGAGGVGYFRWRLPDDLLDRLATRAQALLSPAERIAFLGNAAALLEAGVLGGGRYLGLLEGFADDPEPEVTRAVLEALATVEATFVEADLRPAFAAFVRRLLAPTAERLGWSRRPGEREAASGLRGDLLGWLADQGADAEARARAESLARAFVADPASVDPSLVATALRVAAIDGDATAFELYRSRFESARDPADRRRWLTALGAFRRPELRARALAYVLDGPVRPNELFAVLGGMETGDESRAAIWAWFTARYDDLRARLPSEFLGRAPSFAAGCNAAVLADARRFFADPAHQVPATADALARAASQVEECLRLRAREGPAVAAYLRGGA